MIKYHLITYGCQMNKSDSERIVSVLKKSGLKPTTKNQADILIFNLCSVRQSAIDRVWGMLGKTKGQMIILTGCILPDDKKKFKNKVDLILNTADLPHWLKKINQSLITSSWLHSPTPRTRGRLWSPNVKPKNISKALRLHSPDGAALHQELWSQQSYLSIKPKYSSFPTAYVPVMTGCNNFCAYCAVPYTRGREQSRPVKDIIQEVHTLIIQGYKLIILLGQNVNSYASQISNFSLFERSLAEGQFPISKKITNLKSQFTNKIQNSIIDFPTLLKIINSIPGDYWLSFITSHPKDMSDELIKCFAECKHLIPYLHLPVQSGSNKIIKKMNRCYTAKHYENLIKKARAASPDMAISTDIIVGFPGETKKDFQATAVLMKKIKFDMAYLAEYSPRSGTSAARLKDNVSPKEKTSRRQILNEILKITALKNNQKLVGKTTESLIKSTGGGFAFGQTRMMKNVKIKIESKNQNLIGQFVDVKIIKAGPWGLEGKLT